MTSTPRSPDRRIASWLFVATAWTVFIATAAVLGYRGHFVSASGAGAAALLLAGAVAARHRRDSQVKPPVAATPAPEWLANVGGEATAADSPAGFVERMIGEQRYALLLRPQIVENLEEDQLATALAALDERTSLVPQGQVVLGRVDDVSGEDQLRPEYLTNGRARLVSVPPLLVDRYPVTNRQYQLFVSAGAYDNLPIWDEEIWPALLDYVDLSGKAGPRFWTDGRHAPGEEDVPVVGVNWYEARAYARWVGKRLPTDAEWVKSGCWPVATGPGMIVQRRYPWGNSWDPLRANLWGSQREKPAPVHEFAQGVSVGGLHQLIGNVWEWTGTSFGWADDPGLSVAAPMKSIRGGAFDTYFESQATCHFSSGESPLNRRHNIGFRLALGLGDLAPHVASRLLGVAPAACRYEPAEEAFA